MLDSARIQNQTMYDIQIVIYNVWHPNSIDYDLWIGIVAHIFFIFLWRKKNTFIQIEIDRKYWSQQQNFSKCPH